MALGGRRCDWPADLPRNWGAHSDPRPPGGSRPPERAIVASGSDAPRWRNRGDRLDTARLDPGRPNQFGAARRFWDCSFGAVLLAAVSWLDDLRGLSPVVRLVAQSAAVAIGMLILPIPRDLLYLGAIGLMGSGRSICSISSTGSIGSAGARLRRSAPVAAVRGCRSRFGSNAERACMPR